MSSLFPISQDVFKTIPTPTVTPTNLSDASDDTLSVRLQQHSDGLAAVQSYLINGRQTNFGVDSGTANSYVITTTSGSPTSYTAGTPLSFVTLNTNTSSCIINVNGGGIANILMANGGPLQGGELTAGSLISMISNGSAFLLLDSAPVVVANLGTITVSATVQCLGASSVGVTFSTSTTGVSVTLNKIGPGVPITMFITNISAGSITVGVNATNPSGTSIPVSAVGPGGATTTLSAGGVAMNGTTADCFSGMCFGASVGFAFN